MASGHRNSSYLLSIVVLSFGLLLNACSVAPGAEPQTPTLAVSTIPIPTPTPTPIVEPVLPPAAAGLAIQPPDFNLEQAEGGETFDLAAAHAVYAWYRQQEGPGMWANDTDFVADMAEYAAILEKQGIELKQATVEGQTFSLLTRGSEILLDFVEDSMLKESDPGRWSQDSIPEWMDVGGEVKLFIGEDGHSYIVKVDTDGNVIAFLNTIGATRDNLREQWIEVRDGQSTMVWDAQKGWVENPLFTVPPEWQGKIDRIETLPDGRTVAIAAAESPDEESLLRVLQQDPNSGEWVNYLPTLGWSGFTYFLENFVDRNIQILERATLPPPLTFLDGTEIPMGLIGIMPMSATDPEGWRIAFIQGYILDIQEVKAADTNGAWSFDNLVVQTGIPLPNGDWQIYVSFYPAQETAVHNIFVLTEAADQETLDGSKDFSNSGLDFASRTTMMSSLYRYVLTHPEEYINQPFIHAISLIPNEDRTALKIKFLDLLRQGEAFIYPENVSAVAFEPTIIDPEQWQKIINSR